MANVINFAGAYMNISMLSNNKRSMEKSARHLSTGEKITQAADDGSAYAISERMRAMIRGLRQANDNAKTATDLLKTAEDALHGTTGLLRRMKDLAVQAANGIYSDADYRAMDDEYQQCKGQLDDIAALTNYNGIPLLDGNWKSRIVGAGGVAENRRPPQGQCRQGRPPTRKVAIRLQ